MNQALRLYQSDPAPASPGATTPTTVQAVVDLYLAHIDADGSAKAHADRVLVLSRFCAAHGPLTLATAKPYHLRLWVDGRKEWASDWSIQRAIRTIQRPFNWAARLGIIDRNPFWGVSHRAGERGRAVEDEEFQRMLRAADALFRRVLVFQRWTGARPDEMSRAAWDDIRFDGEGAGWITLLKHKTVRTQKVPKPRDIMLHPAMVKLLTWLRRRAIPGQQTIFINSKGNPWTSSSLAARITRIRGKAGLPRDCKLYGLRHSFATNAVVNGIDMGPLAQLLGHTTTRMAEHYVHLAGRKKYLLDAVRQAIDGPRK